VLNAATRKTDTGIPMQEDLDPLYQRDPATGIWSPRVPVRHCADQYDPALFRVLLRMQPRHFWYRGRHRFVLHALKRELRSSHFRGRRLRAIDLGGGCGGWISYLARKSPAMFAELALADSSLECLQMARDVASQAVRLYHADLRRLDWKERWDVAFLLDVVEHLPDHLEVLGQVRQILRPGGLALVTAPALNVFWSHNDELVGHVRRYSRRDLRALADNCTMELRWSRYFMFLLSPLVLLHRLRNVDSATLSDSDRVALIERTHRTPPPWLNATLASVFSLETPLGFWLPFPWGTSVLGVFQKPLA